MNRDVRGSGRRNLTLGLATLLALCLLAAAPSVATAASGKHKGQRDRYTHTTIRPTKAIRTGTGALQAASDGLYGHVGVASFNILADMTEAQKRADLTRLTTDPRVDLVGFQEANSLRPLLKTLPTDWTFWMTGSGTSREVAVAWRSDRFALVSAATYRMHLAVEKVTGHLGALDRSFRARYTTEATFTELRSGAEFTLFNAHVNQFTEAFHVGKPGVPYDNINAEQARIHFRTLTDMVAASDSRYTAVVGDLNWDHVADQIKHPAGFVQDTLGAVAVSSYKSLGIGQIKPTNRETGRYIDYVMLTRDSHARFLTHDSLGGYHSDHRPLVAVLALN